MMNATEFEIRHRKLLHQLLVAAAFVPYLYDREDIVWRFVKSSSAPHELERILFLAATLAVAAGAVLCTWSRGRRKVESEAEILPTGQIGGTQVGVTQALGEILYAAGLGSLFPLSGFLILVIGLRFPAPATVPCTPAEKTWRVAFRKEAVKWGILITMIVFVITLIDRVAEYLAAASFLVGLLLNLPSFRRRPADLHL
jgi:small-conductance mechanosensitive channel